MKNTSSVSTGTLSYFPSQKLSSREKTKEWGIQCIESASNLIFNRQDWIRQSVYNKKVNFNLANNVMDEEELHKVFNPMGIQYGEFPVSIQHYNKAITKINLLTGEEWKRPFEWKVACLNEDAISGRETELRDRLMQIATEEIQKDEFNPTLVEQRIKNLDKYMKYEYQDIRELTATRLLNYHWYEQRMQYKFNKGFQEALIAGEETYRTDIVSGNPIFEKCNPLAMFILRVGDSYMVEDAEIIIEVQYMPVGKVVEEFYEELTGEDIKFLEEGVVYTGNNMTNYVSTSPIWTIPEDRLGKMGRNGIFDLNNDAVRWFGGWFNEHKEIRIVRCRWKSRLKRQILTYFDENGTQQEEIVSEYYKANKELGETLRTIWINEWWEGTKIGPDIFVKVKPRPVQFRNIANPAISGSGYVGSFYNINTNKVMSMMDRMRPFQYMYNLFLHKLLLALARYKGPTEVLPFHMKPSGWSNDQWLYYKDALGILALDPFNAATEGVAKGTLAGSMNTVLPQIIDSSAFGNYISQMLNLIQYADNQIGEIAGVTKEREGNTTQTDTVGGIERSVTQSSHITEPWFILHEDTKLRALTAFLETCKVAYKNRKDVKIHYILDDLSREYLQFNGEEFSDSEFGIKLVNSSRLANIQQKYDMLVQAGLQNDKINFSQAMDIYNSDSMSSIRRKIELFEDEKIRQMEQQQQQQLQSQQQIAQQQQETQTKIHEDNMVLEREKLQNAMDMKLLDIELGKEKIGIDNNSDQLWARIEEQQSRLNAELQEKKIRADKELKEKQLVADKENNNRSVREQERANKVKEQQKERELKIKDKIASKKPTTTKK